MRPGRVHDLRVHRLPAYRPADRAGLQQVGLYARLIDLGQHYETLTSRPRLLGSMAWQTEHAVRLLHAQADELKRQIIPVVVSSLKNYPANAPDRLALPA